VARGPGFDPYRLYPRSTRYVRTLRMRNFSGGLNLRDVEPELATNESPDLWNVTLDERGVVQKRLGFIKSNPVAHNASKVTNVFYWASGQNKITQSGTQLYKDDSVVSFKTFTTTERCGFADFNGKLYFIHPTDGLFNYDGAAVTAVAGVGAPKGTCLAAWQNYLLAAGDPGAKSTLYRSKLADGTVWDTAAGAATNQLREKDQEAIVALAGGASGDIIGRPSLIVCKRRSTYRVYDSGTLAYQTLDWVVGAASALSVVNHESGRTIILSERGIFWTSGATPLEPASKQLQPIWADSQLAYDQQDLWCAGFKGTRVRFSLCRAGSTVNDLALEYHPLEGWITAGSNAMSCYASYQKNAEKLLGGSPTVNGQVYELDRGGSDDGASIASRFQTRWYEPAEGFLVSMLRGRVIGRGAFTLYRAAREQLHGDPERDQRRHRQQQLRRRPDLRPGEADAAASTAVWLEFWAPAAAKGTTSLSVEFFDGATGVGGAIAAGFASTRVRAARCGSAITPSAGAHTYSVKAWVDAGSGSIVAGTGAAAANLPAYLRITKA
jgi:hypothetical protein